MEANKKRFIRVAGELIEVSKEVYLTYYRGKRREIAQHEKEQFHHVVSFDALDTEGLQGAQMIANTPASAPPVRISSIPTACRINTILN